MRRVLSVAVLSVGTCAISGGAFAQDTMKTPAISAPASAARVLTWSDPEFAAISGRLTGSWKTTAPIEGGDVFIHFAPVVIAGLPDAMYMEVAKADMLDRPYRQCVIQFVRTQGKVSMKTMEFRRPRGEFSPVIGAWAAPEIFSTKLSMNDLVTTLVIDLAAAGGGYSGKTAHPYPTSTGNASEMTSEISFDATTLRTADRGMMLDGSQAWGPAAGQVYSFSKVPSPASVKRFPGGLVSIDYTKGVEGEAAVEGTRVRVLYIGMLEDGFVFDSSYQRGSPFEYPYGQMLMAGWTTAMSDAQKGIKRRLIIPGALGFGENGSPRNKVPANATLIISVEVVEIVKSEPIPTKPSEEEMIKAMQEKQIKLMEQKGAPEKK